MTIFSFQEEIAVAASSFYAEIERKKERFIAVISNCKWFYLKT